MAGEWPTLTLREAGVTLIDCDHRTPPASEAGYPYVAIPQLRNGRIDLSDVRRITHENFVEWTRKAKPSANDVVLSRRCNPGETAFVPPDLEFALGQNLVLLRSHGTKVYPPFLRWLVRGPEWWEQIGKFLNVGAVFDSLKCADVPKFELQIPPMDDQRAIAHILGTLDDKIELNRRMNETLEAIARAMFKSWFVDFDPVRAKASGEPTEPICRRLGLTPDLLALFPDRLVDSELGEIPAGWEATKIEVATSKIFSGGTPDTRKAEYWGGELNWCSSGETRNRFIIETEKKITQSGVNNSSTKAAVPGDILIASAGQGHTRGQTSYCAIDTFINQSVVSVRANTEKARPYWLFYNLASRYEEMRGLSDSHSSRGSLTTKLLGGMSLTLPPISLVKAFDDIVGPLANQQIKGAQQSITLAALRDSLLPKFLSGELRVSEADSNIEVCA